MKRLILILFVFLFVFTSCNTESVDVNDNVVEGTWKLTTWTVGIPVDLNNDTVFSTNLIEEIPCENMETLTFSVDGTVASNVTFNPDVMILFNEILGVYVYQVNCEAEGSIGFAASYEHKGASVFINDREAVVNGNRLTMIYKKAQKIHNLAKTDVVDVKDITLVYTKQ
ncbi:hypothetical protein [Aestuariibaculum suncheonense]|uniref:Lipocalin-like domain-containing protein n=1 Tax=Aestuariibaculum suncheonense TaxID=1028745 RepID=A0A8J6UAQ4_9FLAO|nr:hypothetical protein [Aestuariibaculum suncheonense]MBD0834662.1 hypothetical protein [Aestuariibaculum suncheonense]